MDRLFKDTWKLIELLKELHKYNYQVHNTLKEL